MILYLLNQIMPLSVRAKGVSLSTATNWFFNFIVGELTPYLQEVMKWRLYPMHGFFCACSFVVGKECYYQNIFCQSQSYSYLSKYTSVRFFSCSTCDTSILYSVVYPETMGVPLEEMDAVFGEGNIKKELNEGQSLRDFHLR
jgi:hypothetical protein